jgi:NTE family protein
MGKNALVINGGISRGAFAVGAIKRILEERPELEFDILVGTGTGSLIIPFVALREIEPLVEIFTTKHNKDIVRKFTLSERLRETSILDASPFWGLLDHYYTHKRFDQLNESSKELYFNTVCLQTRELTVFSNKPAPAINARYAFRTIDNYDQFLRTLLASSCQPVMMPPITIRPSEEPVRQYIDGGDCKHTGIEIAVAAGATDIYVLLLAPETPAPDNREFNDLFSIIQTTLDIFIAGEADNNHILPNLYNEGLLYIDSVKRKMRNKGVPESMIADWFETDRSDSPFFNTPPVKIQIIRPDRPLGGGPDGLDFDPTTMQDMLVKGEEKVIAWFANTDHKG